MLKIFYQVETIPNMKLGTKFIYRHYSTWSRALLTSK